MSDSLSRSDVRKVVREVLRDELAGITALLVNINTNLDQIMATQAEAAATLRAQAQLLNETKDLVAKVSTETTSLLDAIKALQDAANNAAITPELEQAVADVVAGGAAVKQAVQAVDAKVPDAVPVPPAP